MHVRPGAGTYFLKASSPLGRAVQSPRRAHEGSAQPSYWHPSYKSWPPGQEIERDFVRRQKHHCHINGSFHVSSFKKRKHQHQPSWFGSDFVRYDLHVDGDLEAEYGDIDPKSSFRYDGE